MRYIAESLFHLPSIAKSSKRLSKRGSERLPDTQLSKIDPAIKKISSIVLPKKLHVSGGRASRSFPLSSKNLTWNNSNISFRDCLLASSKERCLLRTSSRTRSVSRCVNRFTLIVSCKPISTTAFMIISFVASTALTSE